jgi:hypothetical protein
MPRLDPPVGKTEVDTSDTSSAITTANPLSHPDFVNILESAVRVMGKQGQLTFPSASQYGSAGTKDQDCPSGIES